MILLTFYSKFEGFYSKGGSENTTRIDEVITFENINYSVFAVAYRGNGHFMALIKLDNVIFAYDGMIADGMLRPAQTDAFRNDYGSMRAQMVWYTQNL